MRTVFSTNEMPHIWVQEKAPNGRGKGNVSFDGDTYRSYSTAIGKRVRGKGKVVGYVLNKSSFSPTTSAHQSALRSAIGPDVPVFTISREDWYEVNESSPSLGRGSGMNFGPMEISRFVIEGLAMRVLRFEAKAKRARANKEWHLSTAAEAAAQIPKAWDFFGKRGKVPTPDAIISKLKREDAKARREREKRRAEEQALWEAGRPERAAVEAARAAVMQERLALWLAGEPAGYIDLPTSHLRLKPDDHEMVETSKGITVSVEEARRGLRFVFGLRSAGRLPWHTNGDQHLVEDTGGTKWKLDRATEEGVRAGCHLFTWEELDRFAGVLGMTPAPALDS